jgi:hypothetical protein
MEPENKLFIRDISVSLDFSENTNGMREGEWVNLKGYYPGIGTPTEELGSTVILDSIDMFLSALKCAFSAKYIKGNLTGGELEKNMRIALRRVEKVKAYIRTLKDGAEAQPKEQPNEGATP